MIKRRWDLAIISFLTSLVIVAWFAQTAPLDKVAKFRLAAAGAKGAVVVPPLVVPVGPGLYAMAFLALAMAVAYAWGKRRSPVWISVPAAAFVAAFLIWAAAGKSLSLIGMLQGSLIGAVPITLAALSGVLCERSGVINIAIEGMMLASAFTSVVVASVTHNLFLGVVAGVLTGALLAAVHAYLSIAYRVDQIVSGTVINIFAIGMTSYLSSRFLQHYGWLNNSGTVKAWSVPFLDRIPILGPLIFSNNPFFFMAIILVIALQWWLFRTRLGLRIRAVGEHPKAADTLGINVHRMRYLSVILGGAVAGLGGAYFTVGSVGRFDEVMTAGKGFIGLAAMIFGKWTPLGSLGASVLFGFADALQTKLQILFIPIPSEFLLMAPYVVTIIVVSGLVGRAVPPAADGQPYD